jgi:hypothetical protein
VIESTAATEHHRRPRAVTVVGWLLCIEGLLLLSITATGMLGAFLEQRTDFVAIGAVIQAGNDLIQVRLPILNTLLGVTQLVAGLGLLRMRSGAWLLAMSIEAVSLAIALRWYALDDPRYGPMALSTFIVLALNQREVRQAFVHHHHADG